MPIDDMSSVPYDNTNYETLSPAWHDGQKYNPATRHRRRLILQLLKNRDFTSVLEIGCGQPYLPQDIGKYKKINFTGTDISQSLIDQNRKEFPEFKFEVLDIVNARMPEQYDMVIASESIEHVQDYKKALEHIAQMAKKYVLITVPSSQVFPIDRMIGHYRHYNPEDITKPLEDMGFHTVAAYKWGFPFHNMYKHLINSLTTPEKMKAAFSEAKYGKGKQLFATLLYWLFFLNIKKYGYQLIVLAERKTA